MAPILECLFSPQRFRPRPSLPLPSTFLSVFSSLTLIPSFYLHDVRNLWLLQFLGRARPQDRL